MGLGRSLKLGRVKKFIQPMQKDSVILFQHRFVSFSIMMLKIDDFVIELVFDVLTKICVNICARSISRSVMEKGNVVL